MQPVPTKAGAHTPFKPQGNLIMNTWLRRTLVGAAAAAALAGSIAAFSQATQADSHFHGGPPSPEDIASHQAHMLEHISKSLDLDAAQQVKLQALSAQLRSQHDKLMGTGTDPHERMKALIAGNTFDRAGAQALVDEKLAAIKANSPALIAAAGDFYDSLRADQQQKVRDFMAKHHGPMGMHHGDADAAGH
jgi:Spy/CpxP family protein refolding chaperone